MKIRLGVTILIFVYLVLTVPWFFIGSETSDAEGLPGWVIYVLAANLLFPFLIAFLHQRFWKDFEGDDEQA